MIIPKMICEHIRLLSVSGGETCEELLVQLGNYAIEQRLAREGFTEGLLKRERNFPTGIQASMGIAIPHTEQVYTIVPTLIIALLEKEVAFRPMGGGSMVPVETVFLLLLNKEEKQVEMLGSIVEFIQDEEKMTVLRTAERPEEFLSSLEMHLN